MWKHADIPKWDVSPLIKPSASEPYYTMSVWHVEACRHTQMRCIPPIKPSASEPYYTMSVWHVEACRHTQMRCIPPNWTQCFRALLHHVCLTCGSMQTNAKWDVSPLIKPSASEPYYTMSIWHVEAWRHTQMRCIPPNQTQCFRALLHHVCLTCGSMQTYPNEMYHPSIKPSASEPYYTTCLFDMWKHADIPKWDVSPQWNPVLQRPTTPYLFDMWKHADILNEMYPP